MSRFRKCKTAVAVTLLSALVCNASASAADLDFRITLQKSAKSNVAFRAKNEVPNWLKILTGGVIVAEGYNEITGATIGKSFCTGKYSLVNFFRGKNNVEIVVNAMKNVEIVMNAIKKGPVLMTEEEYFEKFGDDKYELCKKMHEEEAKSFNVLGKYGHLNNIIENFKKFVKLVQENKLNEKFSYIVHQKNGSPPKSITKEEDGLEILEGELKMSVSEFSNRLLTFGNFSGVHYREDQIVIDFEDNNASLSFYINGDLRIGGGGISGAYFKLQ